MTLYREDLLATLITDKPDKGPALIDLLNMVPYMFCLIFSCLMYSMILCREDLLATLLSQMEGLSNPPVKRVPSYVAPDLAAAIRRQLALSLR